MCFSCIIPFGSSHSPKMCVCEGGETIFSLIHKWGSKRNIARPGAQGQQVPEAEAEPRSA